LNLSGLSWQFYALPLLCLLLFSLATLFAHSPQAQSSFVLPKAAGNVSSIDFSLDALALTTALAGADCL